MKHAKKKKVIKLLFNVPIVSSVCEQVGISRQTYYRWLKEDPEFSEKVYESLSMGKNSINDMAESLLINLMKDGNLGAVKFWLSNNHRSYVRPRSTNFFLNDEAVKKLSENKIIIADFSQGKGKDITGLDK